jgi:hypothetical protein
MVASTYLVADISDAVAAAVTCVRQFLIFGSLTVVIGWCHYGATVVVVED